MFRANPQNQRDLGLVGGIISALFLLGILYYLARSLLRILNGDILLGIAGLIPPIAVVFLLVAALGLTNGGGRS